MQVPKGKTVYFGKRKYKSGEELPHDLSNKLPELTKEQVDFEFLKVLDESKADKPKKKRKYIRKKKK